MNLFELVAKIVLDTSQYEAGVRSAQTDQQKLVTGMQNVQGSAEALRSRMQTLGAQYTKAAENVQRLTNEYNKSVKETGATSDATQSLVNDLDEAENTVVSLTRRVRDYREELNESTDATERDTKSMGLDFVSKGAMIATGIGMIINTVWNFAESAVSALSSLGRGLVNTYATLARFGLTYNMEIESYTTNFKVMLGDAEAAAQKVEELREMAAKTPFGLADLADATQTMLAFGIEAQNTNEILQQLGDIASGDAQRLKSLVLVYSQVASLGKLQGQDWRQMVGVGFNPLESLSEYAGLTVGQLQEIMSGASKESLKAMKNMKGVTDYGKQIIDQGYISITDLQKALELATAEGGQFHNGMAEASKTVSGQLSTLKDNASELIGKFFQPMSTLLGDTILPKANELVGAIEKMANPETAEEGQQAFSRLVGEIVDGTTMFIEGNAPTFAKAGVTILLAMANGIAENAGPLAEAMAVAISAVMIELEQHAPEIASATGNLIAKIVEAIFVDFYENIEPNIEKLAATIAGELPTLVQSFIGGANWEGVYGNAGELLGEGLLGSRELATNFFGSAADITGLVAEEGPGFINTANKSFLGSFGDAVGGLFGYSPFASIAKAAGENIGGSSRSFGDSIIERVDLQVNIGGTSATPDEIGEAVLEALSVGLKEFSQGKAAAYGN